MAIATPFWGQSKAVAEPGFEAESPQFGFRISPLPVPGTKNAKKAIFHRLGKGCDENPMQMGTEA